MKLDCIYPDDKALGRYCDFYRYGQLETRPLFAADEEQGGVVSRGEGLGRGVTLFTARVALDSPLGREMMGGGDAVPAGGPFDARRVPTHGHPSG